MRSNKHHLWILLLCLAALPPYAFAHEGHTHAEPVAAPTVDATTSRMSVGGWGESFELTVVYSATDDPRALPVRLLLSEKGTNLPASDAVVALTLTGGQEDAAIEARPGAAPGAYTANLNLELGTNYSLLVDVTKGTVSDFFSIDNLKAPVAPTTDVLYPEDAAGWRRWMPHTVIGLVAAVLGFLAGKGTSVVRKRQAGSVS